MDFQEFMVAYKDQMTYLDEKWEVLNRRSQVMASTIDRFLQDVDERIARRVTVIVEDNLKPGLQQWAQERVLNEVQPLDMVQIDQRISRAITEAINIEIDPKAATLHKELKGITDAHRNRLESLEEIYMERIANVEGTLQHLEQVCNDERQERVQVDVRVQNHFAVVDTALEEIQGEVRELHGRVAMHDNEMDGIVEEVRVSLAEELQSVKAVDKTLLTKPRRKDSKERGKESRGKKEENRADMLN